MPCDTCFHGHVARRYRWQQSFEPMTSLNLTFDAGQVKVRSRSGQIFKSMFLHKKRMFLAQNFRRIPSILLVVVVFGTQARSQEKISEGARLSGGGMFGPWGRQPRGAPTKNNKQRPN